MRSTTPPRCPSRMSARCTARTPRPDPRHQPGAALAGACALARRLLAMRRITAFRVTRRRLRPVADALGVDVPGAKRARLTCALVVDMAPHAAGVVGQKVDRHRGLG